MGAGHEPTNRLTISMATLTLQVVKLMGGLVKYVNAAFTLYPQQIVLFSILTTGVIQG